MREDFERRFRGMRIPEEWLERGVRSDELSEITVFNDRWDRRNIERMLSEYAAFAAATDKLTDFTPTGRPAMSDVFFTLFKANPRLLDESEVQPSHLVNLAVQEELRKLHETERLRRFSVGDDVQTALSCTELEPEVETLFDKLHQQQKQAQELAELLQQLADAADGMDGAQADLDAMMESLGGGGGGGEDSDSEGEDGEGGQRELTDAEKEAIEQLAQVAQKARELYEQLQQEAQTKGAEFEESMKDMAPSIAVQLRDMLDKAAKSAGQLNETAQAWGLEAGTLHRLDPQERLKLAEKLNSPRLRKIAELFGPMRNMALSEQERKTRHAKEEIVDVELGSDLSRLLPSEALALTHPLLRKNFLRKFMTRSLMQYSLEGTERLARGGIVLAEDGSGSMHGDRELWAKALMLCLLNLARIQKRSFHLIHFGGPGEIHYFPFVKPEDFTFDRILQAAEVFSGGGTDFQTPMAKALEILEEEHGRLGFVKADVVFVTDDECGVTHDFMDDYLDRMKAIGSTTWGVTVNRYPPAKGGALETMSEGKTAMVSDFHSGEQVRNVFRGL